MIVEIFAIGVVNAFGDGPGRGSDPLALRVVVKQPMQLRQSARQLLHGLAKGGAVDAEGHFAHQLMLHFPQRQLRLQDGVVRLARLRKGKIHRHLFRLDKSITPGFAHCPEVEPGHRHR